MRSRKRVRKLGQHFLVRPAAVVRWLRPRLCGLARVLEVGAGRGDLTRYLADCVAEVVACEVDQAFLPELEALASVGGLVSVEPVNADALNPPYRLGAFDAVFGNIPYSITGPLLSMLVKLYQGPVYVMLQREVALRLASRPGEADYGRLTVLVKLVYDVELGPVIPPSAFNPPPKVYSQLVGLRPRRRCSPRFIECVERLTTCLFSSRRKNALKVVKGCIGGALPPELEGLLQGLRVYELDVTAVEEIAVRLGVCDEGCHPLRL